MRRDWLVVAAVLGMVGACRVAALSTGAGGAPASVVDQPRPRAPVQVITDIDDTIKSSGGVRVGTVPIGGIDTQYERGEFYPGVFKFMVGLADHGAPPQSEPFDAAVLTARAREFQWALAVTDNDPICRRFRLAGQQAGRDGWGIGTVLYGSVNEWVFQSLKGWRKFENFKILLSQAPRDDERCYVFVGDTGELDQEAGELMLIQYAHKMRGLFLHVVGDAANPPPLPDDIFINGRPVLFFRTYVSAAWKAAKHGLMSLDGVMEVAREACEELHSVNPASTKWIDVKNDLLLVAQEAQGLLDDTSQAMDGGGMWAESRDGLRALKELAGTLVASK